jgi:hypothetical protein
VYQVAKKFPLIPAKLLLMGLPFELMNGDISHVPIVWVKAVLMELEHLVLMMFISASPMIKLANSVSCM